MMTITFMTAVIKVLNHSEDYFYASDLGIQGGTIQALEEQGYIERSGKTKEYLLAVGDNLFRKVTVIEWHIVTRKLAAWKKTEFERYAAEILTCADLLRSECGY